MKLTLAFHEIASLCHANTVILHLLNCCCFIKLLFYICIYMYVFIYLCIPWRGGVQDNFDLCHFEDCDQEKDNFNPFEPDNFVPFRTVFFIKYFQSIHWKRILRVNIMEYCLYRQWDMYFIVITFDPINALSNPSISMIAIRCENIRLDSWSLFYICWGCNCLRP